jgi:transposase
VALIKSKRTTKRVKLTRCKLSKKDQLKLIEFFVLGVTARSAADLLEMQPNTTALFYRKIREIIAFYLSQEAKEMFNGDFVIDETAFGISRRGKRPLSDDNKKVVFGILAREGKIFTKMTSQINVDLITDTAHRIVPDSVVYGDSKAEALDVNEFQQERVHQPEIIDATKYSIGDTENFWNQTKRVLRKYNGIPKSTFPLFLKECEFRFNYGSPKQQLKTLKAWTGI